jgi:transposase-like protein
MPRTWKKRTPEFRQQAMERMQEARDLGLLAKELCVSVRTLYRWKDIQLGRVKKVREPVPRETKLESEIQQLKQSLANRSLEVDFFKGALQKIEARRRKSADSGARASTTRSGE